MLIIKPINSNIVKVGCIPMHDIEVVENKNKCNNIRGKNK